MTDDEARKLAQRMTDTWPNGPRAYIWRDILLPLDPTIAANVYRTMRDNAITPPSPAAFGVAYRQALARTIQQPELPLAPSNVIGLADYIATLEARDDPELEHWQRLQRR